jgi:hypothetical protein
MLRYHYCIYPKETGAAEKKEREKEGGNGSLLRVLHNTWQRGGWKISIAREKVVREFTQVSPSIR